MDNVRRLSELVDGNVEHVKVLTSLVKNSQWKPILEFLSECELNSTRKIAGVRRILSLFENCENDTALKKRYLQVRVQRAAANKATLTEEELIGKLESQRLSLLSKLTERDDRIRLLYHNFCKVRKQEIALSSLFFTCESTISAIRTAKDKISQGLKTGQPILDSSTVDIIPAALTASLDNAVNHIHNRFEGDNSSDMDPTCSSIMSLDNYSVQKVIMASLKYLKKLQKVAAKPLDKQMIDSEHLERVSSNVNNIQRTAIELARIIALIKNDQDLEQAKSKLDTLQRSCEGSVLEAEDIFLDLLKANKIKADSKELQTQSTPVFTKAIDTLKDLIENCARIKESTNQIPSIALEAYTKIIDCPVGESASWSTSPQQLTVEEINDNELDAIVLKYCLEQSVVPNFEPVQKEILGRELLLENEMKETKAAVTESYNAFLAEAECFSQECKALELFQRPDYKKLTFTLKDKVLLYKCKTRRGGTCRVQVEFSFNAF